MQKISQQEKHQGNENTEEKKVWDPGPEDPKSSTMIHNHGMEVEGRDGRGRIEQTSRALHGTTWLRHQPGREDEGVHGEPRPTASFPGKAELAT